MSEKAKKFVAGGGEIYHRNLPEGAKEHLFFLGTLFQPALTSNADEPNPLIIEFVKASLSNEPKRILTAKN